MSILFDDLKEGLEQAVEFEKGEAVKTRMLKATTLQSAELLDILPDEDISMVNAFIKKLVIAWDPDFTKVNEREREILEKSDSEMRNGEFISEEEFWKT